MRTQFEFTDVDGEKCTVSLAVTEDSEAERPYGIWAGIKCDSGEEEEAEAGARFYTYAEAEQVMKMLCREQVTPCTLCDII